MLTENVKALGAVWGQAFINLLKPLVIALNEAMASITAFSVNVVNALGKIFGWKVDIQNVGISQDFEDASDSIDDATGSAKKLKQQLQGIDELNVLNTDQGGSGSGLGNISASGNQQGGFNIVEDEDSFKSKIKDLEGLGEYISDALQKAMKNIKWKQIYKKASGFGTGLAQFLNGLFNKDKDGNSVFSSLGDTIASALNSVLYSVFSFADTFDWYNFGDVLHDGINHFITTFDWEAAGFTVGKLVKGIATSIYALLKDKETWKNLGKKIAQGVNSFLSSMKEVDPETGKNGWQITAAAFNSFVQAVIECIREAISGITWKDIISGIADFLGELNLSTILVAIGLFKWKYKGQTFFKFGNLLASLFSTLSGGEKELSIPTMKLAVGTFLITLGVFKFLDENDIPSKIIKAIKELPSKIFVKDKATKFDGEQVELEIPLSWKIKSFKLNWNKVKKHLTFKDLIENVFNFDKSYNLLELAKDTFTIKVPEAWKSGDLLAVGEEIVAGILEGIGSALTAIVEPFVDLFNWVYQGICDVFDIHSPARTMYSIGENIVLGIIKGFTEFPSKIKSKMNEAWEIIKTWWGDKKLSVSNKLSTVRNDVRSWWEDKLKPWWGDKKLDVQNVLKTTQSTISSWWNSIKSWWGTGKTLTVDTEVKQPTEHRYAGIQKANGGVFNGRRWASIDQYASGGTIPNHGTHFIAGEKGAEVVGNINNRTEVLNQSQLASVMYDAVVSGMQAVMGSNNQNPIQVFLDGKVVFDSNRQYAADYTRRTGKPAFPY